MAQASMSVWGTLQEKIPGLWRISALARKVTGEEALRKMQFNWPIYDVWRYFQNRESKRLYQIQKDMAPGPLERQVIKDLEGNGISIVQFDDLFPGSNLSDFQELAQRWLNKPTNQQKISAIESAVHPTESKEAFTGADKFYIVPLFGDMPVFDLHDKFLKLAVSDQILRIVCGYLGLFSRLVYMDIWYNIPTTGPEVYSQRWHRDPDDRKEVKVFFYLRDVDKGSGPFNYIPGTHNGGRFRRVIPQTIRVSRYPPEGAIEKRFSEDRRQVCTGPAGTLIFADTTGFHKGGAPTTTARLLFTAVYTTNAGTPLMTGSSRYSISESGNRSFSAAAEYATSHPRE